jgi:transposase InsO family protein
MKQAGLLLSRGHPHPNRSHDGQVITLKSNLRWCTDIFEVRCWDGRKLHAAFVLDCCDREAIAWVAKPQHLTAQDICDLMAEAVESRFSDTSVPHPIEWLSDNGGAFTAYETRRFAASCGLLVRTTPAYSPESNGMAEAFVKTFKRDYAYLSDVGSPEQVMRQLPAWFDDHNEITPHKGLGMLSPRMYLRANQ